MIKKVFTHEYIEDVIRIKKVALDLGYEADLKDCAEIWDEVSDSMSAGWLVLPKDDDILADMIQSYLEERCE